MRWQLALPEGLFTRVDALVFLEVGQGGEEFQTILFRAVECGSLVNTLVRVQPET